MTVPRVQFRFHTLFLCLFVIAAFGHAEAHAQRKTRQTDLALSGFGAFTGAATNLSNGAEAQIATSAGGGLLEFRQIRSGLVGFEGTYSLQRANQFFDYQGAIPFLPACIHAPCIAGNTGPFMTSVSAMTHEVSGDWIFSTTEKSVRVFALAGLGARITVPTSSPSGAQTSTSATLSYIYGLGADWQFLPRWGLRVQYRGDIHQMPAVANALVLPYSTSAVAPGAATPLSSPSGYEHDAEPMIGVYYRF